MNLDTKIALVTGANTGIGNALTQKLIAENYFVIGTSRNGKIENINSENLFVVS
jgi:NAD(P)-dependent dehydrogenase (short-subunit alcohol dehydrogenase family)